MEDLIQKYGLATLKIILKKGNKARYNQILEDFPATSGTLSRVLKALEREGFIERFVDANSRPPVSYYSVTEKGLKVVASDVAETLTLYSPLLDEEDRKVVEDFIQRLKQKYRL